MQNSTTEVQAKIDTVAGGVATAAGSSAWAMLNHGTEIFSFLTALAGFILMVSRGWSWHKARIKNKLREEDPQFDRRKPRGDD